MNSFLKLVMLLLASSCAVSQSAELQSRRLGSVEISNTAEEGLFSVGEEAVEAVEGAVAGVFRRLMMATGTMDPKEAKKAARRAAKEKNKAKYRKALKKAKGKCKTKCRAGPKSEYKACRTQCVADAKTRLRKKFGLKSKKNKQGAAGTLGGYGGSSGTLGGYGGSAGTLGQYGKYGGSYTLGSTPSDGGNYR